MKLKILNNKYNMKNKLEKLLLEKWKILNKYILQWKIENIIYFIENDIEINVSNAKIILQWKIENIKLFFENWIEMNKQNENIILNWKYEDIKLFIKNNK